MKKRNWLSVMFITVMVLIMLFGGFYETSFAAKKGKVTKIVSNEPTGITQEEMRQQEPDFYSLSGKKTKKPKKRSDTVSRVKAKANKKQVLYLWDKGNVPAQTKYTKNDGDYFDNPSFVPYMTTMPAKKGKKVKGAVVLCAGGAFMFRGNYTDSIPVAKELNKRGYHCFIVDYRLDPYTQEEGALDVARAVRFIRKNAKVYKIDKKDIALMGFSAGGIQVGEELRHFKGKVTGKKLDKSYKPDKLDKISANAAACGMIYSFYGELSIAEKSVKKLRAGKLPPTYFCYGTLDPFVDEFQANIKALGEAGVNVTYQVLENTPHGFGAMGNWISEYDKWLDKVFKKN